MLKYAPMLLVPVIELPQGEEWIYEPKWDGFRILGEVVMGHTFFTSRHDKDFTPNYPIPGEQLPTTLTGHSAHVDGEIVAFDDAGQPNFSVIQRKSSAKVYFLFDLLELDGAPLVDLPFHERRRHLEEVFVPQPNIQLTPQESDRKAMREAAEEQSLEGIVAKKLDSTYRPGRHGRDWPWRKQIFIPHPERFHRKHA